MILSSNLVQLNGITKLWTFEGEGSNRPKRQDHTLTGWFCYLCKIVLKNLLHFLALAHICKKELWQSLCQCTIYGENSRQFFDETNSRWASGIGRVFSLARAKFDTDRYLFLLSCLLQLYLFLCSIISKARNLVQNKYVIRRLHWQFSRILTYIDTS